MLVSVIGIELLSKAADSGPETTTCVCLFSLLFSSLFCAMAQVNPITKMTSKTRAAINGIGVGSG